jgi:hypothetical protein
METEGSLPRFQLPTTCTYPEAINPVHALTSHFLKNHLKIFFPFTPSLKSGHFSPGYPNKIL